MIGNNATPGPWEVDFETGEIIAQGNVVLGTIYGANDYPCLEEDISDECRANARLVAAAPDLLAACEAFVEAWEKCLQLEKTDVALAMATAAIARAKGSDE